MDLNVLIVGGGIHGVGILHDLASRNIHGVHLVEEKIIASGTSSRSTKLVHGGLRYLEHLEQWPLVHEALHERTLLLRLLKNIVKPLPILLPVFKDSKRPPWMLRLGLFFYDFLSGDCGLPSASQVKKEEILKIAPYFKKDRIESEMLNSFLYYDAQMLDDVIARIIAESSKKLGATYEENAKVISLEKIPDGYKVQIKNQTEIKTVTTRFLINAAGAWCNSNLLNWGIQPNYACLLNLGTHIVFNEEVVQGANIKDCVATLIQENDGRVVFFIPWFGKWLFGTTESILNDKPSNIKYPAEDKKYLMQTAHEMFNLHSAEENISEIFCGVRCMPLKDKIKKTQIQVNWQEDPFHSPYYLNKIDKNISGLSRETVIDEILPGLINIYGGKYTTYRAISEKIGSIVSRRLQLGAKSKTHLIDNWFLSELMEEKPEIFESSKNLRQI